MTTKPKFNVRTMASRKGTIYVNLEDLVSYLRIIAALLPTDQRIFMEEVAENFSNMVEVGD